MLRIQHLFCLLLLGALLFNSCKKDVDDSPEPDPGPQDPIDVIILECDDFTISQDMLALQEQEPLLINVDSTETDYIFHFDNEIMYQFCQDAIESVLYNEETWTSTIVLTDETSFEFPSGGSIELEVEINPSGYNPLSVMLSLSAVREGKASVRIVGKYGPDSDYVHAFDAVGTDINLPIYGLYSNHINLLEVTFSTENGTLLDQQTIEILTDYIDIIDPEITILEANRSMMEPGEFHLVSSLSYWEPNVPYMFDTYGEIRWLLDFSNHEDLAFLYYDVGIERLANGNLYFGDGSTASLYEVDLFGNVVNTWPLPSGYGFHHNVLEKPDGNFLVSVNKWGELHQNGLWVIEDHLIELDRNSGALVKEWDFRELLDEDRWALGYFVWDYVDWMHINGIAYSEIDNSIIVSGRHQCVIKVDYDDDIKWILAPHDDWGNNGRGEDCEDYLLTAIDANGNPYGNGIQNGFNNAPDFEWNWYQHAPLILPSGNIMVFDNGDSRNFGDNNQDYSRAVEFKIDEDNMTVQQIWQYGKERGPECWGRICSDVDYHPQTGNILFAPGVDVLHNGYQWGGRVVEVDYESKEVYFEAHVGSNGIAWHRVERMDFYSF